MRTIPIEVIANWPVPNYTNPVTQGHELVTINAFFISVVALVVMLRLYVRIFMLRWFGLDDAFIVIALLSSIGMTTCAVVAYETYGYNKHIWDLPLSQLKPALQLGWWSKIVYSLAAMFTRLSLLIFYYRLTKDSSQKWFRWSIHASVVVSITAGLCLTLFTIFQCKPISAFWTFPAIPGQCLDDGKVTLYCGIANTFADSLVVILPIPLIAQLDLPFRRRVGAIILVSLGFAVCVAGAVRAYFTWLSLIATYDETWNCFGLYISAAVEIDLGVICACAPALRVILVRVAKPCLARWGKSISRKSPFSSSLGYGIKSRTTGSSHTALDSKTDETEVGMTFIETFSKQNPVRSPLITDDMLKEKGFIVTAGGMKHQTWAPPRYGDDVDINFVQEQLSPGYLWDAPWNGENAPLPRRSSIATAGTDITRNTTPVSQQVGIAVPMKIMRTTSVSVLSQVRPRVGAPKFDVAEQKGVGVLPDSATAKEVSSGDSFTTTTTTTTTSSDSSNDDDVLLPIQRPASPAPEKQRAPVVRTPARVLQLSEEPYFGDMDRSRRSRSREGPRANGLSFLAEGSRDSLPTPTREYVRQQHVNLWEAVGGDRARVLNRRDRSVESRPPSSAKG